MCLSVFKNLLIPMFLIWKASEMEDRHSRACSLSGSWKCRNLGQVAPADNYTFSTAAMM